MKRLYLAILVQLPFLFVTFDAFARAGGGGSHGKGGGLLGVILLPFIYFMYWLIRRRASMRDKKISAGLGALAAHESHWDESQLRARIENIFFAVQNAWMMRDQEPAKQYMSDRLYQKHKMQTDMMIRDNTQNMLENINLVDVKLVSLEDYQGSRDDRLVAYIEGTMIDYTLNVSAGVITDNPEKTNDRFREFWHFILENEQWVLDEIDQSADWSDFSKFKVYSSL